jgi:hypothetical protein
MLFLAMLWLLARAHFEAGWGRRRLGLVLLSSVVPLWPFVLDRRLRQWIHESEQRAQRTQRPAP